MTLYKIAKYLITPLEGPDNKLSGKRIIGTCFAIVACYTGIYGVKHAIEHIAEIGILVGTFIMGAGMFWSITSFADFKNQQLNSSTTLTTNQDTDKEEKTNINTTSAKKED